MDKLTDMISTLQVRSRSPCLWSLYAVLTPWLCWIAVDPTQKNFAKYAEAQLEMSRTACSVAQDVAQFYQRCA